MFWWRLPFREHSVYREYHKKAVREHLLHRVYVLAMLLALLAITAVT